MHRQASGRSLATDSDGDVIEHDEQRDPALKNIGDGGAHAIQS
jgi:hypothetical protein